MGILEKAVELKRGRKSFVLATVIEAQGSTPAKTGAKLILTEDQKLFGTVGGGLVEAEVLKKAKEALTHRENKILEYNLTKGESGLGMNCGGSVKLFLEVYKPSYRLILWGGGHVGYEIARLMAILKLETILVEERSELATEERFPTVSKILVTEKYTEALKEIEIDEYTFVVIVTKGSTTDEIVLEGVINTPAVYIGMMGSKRKKVEVMKSMLSKGYSKDSLNKVYCPIGLDLGATSPEEIALSIVAEIIRVKNGGSGEHLKEM